MLSISRGVSPPENSTLNLDLLSVKKIILSFEQHGSHVGRVNDIIAGFSWSNWTERVWLTRVRPAGLR